VTWRVLATQASEPDFAALTEDERDALNEELFRWVDAGPPRGNRRVVGGVQIYEALVLSQFRVTYLVYETEPYVAVLKVRRA